MPMAHLLLKLKHGEIQATPINSKPNKKISLMENLMDRRQSEGNAPDSPGRSPVRKSFDMHGSEAKPRASVDLLPLGANGPSGTRSPRGSIDMGSRPAPKGVFEYLYAATSPMSYQIQLHILSST